jgi:RNA polymerase sigma factor (sigma-70 family)
MTRSMPVDEQALVLGAQRSADGFAALYRHFERPVLAFFLRCTGRAELAADLTAETFAAALESVARYDADRGRCDQWLFGIARNVLGKSQRRGRVDSSARERLALPVLVLDDDLIERVARLTGDAGPAVRALGGLPEEQRTAVQARIVHERDYAEIAAELECSEAVVRQRVSRGLRTLRTRLAGER